MNLENTLKRIQEANSENDIEEIIKEFSSVKTKLFEWEKIKEEISKKTFLSNEFILIHRHCLNKKTLTKTIVHRLTKKDVNKLIKCLDIGVLAKHKKIKYKKLEKNNVPAYSFYQFLKKRKLKFKKLQEILNKYHWNAIDIQQFTKKQHLSQKQILKIIKENPNINKKYITLSYKSKFLLNLNKPKHYSRKMYIDLLKDAIKNHV
jgi:hypothetical protein